MNLWGKDRPFPQKNLIRIKLLPGNDRVTSSWTLDSSIWTQRTAWLTQNTQSSATPSSNAPGAKRFFSPGATANTKKVSLSSFCLFMHSTYTSYWQQHRQLNFQLGAKPNGATLCSGHRYFHWHLFHCFPYLHKVTALAVAMRSF
jgi:hypothetical protein